MPSSPRSPIYACQLLCAVGHSLEVEVDQDIEAVVALAQDIRVLRPDDRNRAEVGADGVGVRRGAAARCGLRGDDGRQVNRGRDGRSRRHGRERGDLGFDLGILAVAWLGGQMALHGGRCGHGGVVLDHGGGAARQGSLITMRRDVCGDGGRLDGWRG